jgi:plasmid stability protein
MSAVTIRNLDHSVKLELRKRAAARGVSMEQHLRDLIMESLARPSKRRLLSVEEILALGVKPERDFDQKKVSDELYSYLEEE